MNRRISFKDIILGSRPIGGEGCRVMPEILDDFSDEDIREAEEEDVDCLIVHLSIAEKCRLRGNGLMPLSSCCLAIMLATISWFVSLSLYGR